MNFFKLSGHYFMAALMMMVFSLGLNAEPVFLDGKGAFAVGKGAFTVGKGNPLNVQIFAKMDLRDGEWRKVVVTAAMIKKGENALTNMHFFALASKKTDNLIILKESKSLVGHNILAAVEFKKNTIVPNIIQNKKNMNIAINVKKSNILKVNYLATTDKILKSINAQNAKVLAIVSKDHKMKFLLTNGKGASKGSNKLVKISFNHINIIKAQPHKFRANAADRLNTNSIVAKVENNATYDITASGLSQNNSNMFMVATFNSNTRIGNRDKTGQHMLHANIAKFFSSNPVESGNKSGKIMLHANAAKITLDPYNTEKKFGQPLDKSFKIISFYGSKAGAKIGQQGNTESGKIMINANLKAPVETSNGRHVSLIITPLAA